MDQPLRDGPGATAREYLRVSKDRSGHLQSPAQQHAENQRAAAVRQWVLGDPYTEPDAVSASRYSGRARAAFDRLRSDIRAGRLGATVLILWESSRGSRKVTEWAHFIEDCEAAGVVIFVTSHGRVYDPRNSRDRRSLQEDAVDSEYESAKVSERTRRTFAAMAAEGRPSGVAPFGYRRLYDPQTRQLTRQEPHPLEAPLVAELYSRLRAGDSFRQIERDWAARGVLTRGTKRNPPRPFRPAHLRQMALSPAYAGLRVHQPVSGGRDRYSLAGAVPGQWPPLTDETTFRAVRRMLLSPDRRASASSRGRHLLSLIAVCGVCGSPLTATYRKGYREYRCRDHCCTVIPADGLDEWARAAILAYLARPDVMMRLRATDDGDAALTAVQAQLETARADLDEWEAEAHASKVGAARFARIIAGKAELIAGLEERERELSAPHELAWLAVPAQEAAAAWERASVRARRQAARFLFSPAWLGTLALEHAPPGRRLPPSERATLRRR